MTREHDSWETVSVVSALEWVRVSLLSGEWRSESATGLHASPEPGLDGTIGGGLARDTEVLDKRDNPEGFGIWGLVGAPGCLQTPVAMETPSKVESENSSKSPSLFTAGED